MPSVLVIDPQEDFTIPLADALRQKGLAITTVSDGKEGVDLAQREKPDAIVLSIEQRGMNGLSICSRLRRDDSTRSIPLVLISVDTSSFANHRTTKSKADAYLAKPFSAVELLGVLTDLIDVTTKDTVSDLEMPPRARAVHQSSTPPALSSIGHSNGRVSSTADLLASDLPLPREDSGAELDWMVKLRQSLARRDAQIAELRARVEEAARMQAAVVETERKHQEELQKVVRERDETVRAHMSMQEKLTSTRLDLDDTKKRAAKEKKTLEERLAQAQKLGEERFQALQKQSEEKLAAQKKQSDDVTATLKRQLDETSQRESEKTAALDAANRQNRSLTQKLEETTRNLEATRKSAAALESQNEKQANRIAQLEDELKKSLADADAKRIAIVRLEDDLAKSREDHANEVFSLGEDLKAAQAGSDAKSKTIAMRDDELAKQKANYEKRLAAADDAIRKANATIDAKTKQHAKDLEAREASITGLKQKITLLSEDLTREKNEHEKMLEVSAEVHAKEMNRLREEHQLRMGQVEQQQRDSLKRLEADRNQIEAERQALETQAIELGKRLASIEKQLSVTRQQLTEQEKKNGELAEKLGAAEARAAEVERVLGEGKRNKQQLFETLGEIGRLVESARDAVAAGDGG